LHPFHFGTRERKLFGIYLPPKGGVSRPDAVVIANPWGWEALRAHRTIRMLATMLQKEGFGVLRFDYFGTGDSFGDEADTDLGGWRDDLESAVEEGFAVSGKSAITLIGLRLGAFIAADVAMRHPGSIKDLVLWEAPARGSDFLKDWTGRSTPPASDLDVKGFHLPTQVSSEIHELDLARYWEVPCRVAFTRTLGPKPVASPPLPEEGSLNEAPGPLCWREEQDFGAGAVPKETLSLIVQCLT